MGFQTFYDGFASPMMIRPIYSPRPDHSISAGQQLEIDNWYNTNSDSSAVTPETLAILKDHIKETYGEELSALHVSESKADWMLTLNAGLVGVGLLQLELLKANAGSIAAFLVSAAMALVGSYLCIRVKMPGLIPAPLKPRQLIDNAIEREKWFLEHQNCGTAVPTADHQVQFMLVRSYVTAIVGLQQLTIWKVSLITSAKYWLLCAASILSISALLAIIIS